MSIYDHWQRYHIEDLEHQMLDIFCEDNPTLGGADTETTGLHIKKDKPFLIVFGWYIPGTDEGRVFTFEPTPKNMEIFLDLASRLKAFVWWNTKFDLHMMANIGWNYTGSNLVEGMALARLSLEAIPAREGGDSLQLTSIGAKYVDGKANMAEKRLRELLKKLRDEKTKVLAAALRQFPLVINGVQQTTPTGKPQNWGKGAIERFLKDITNTIDDLPQEVREVWEFWNSDYGGSDVTYKEVYDRYPEEMIKYAQDDVITMMIFAKKAYPTVASRKQMGILKRENQVILPLYNMERVGVKTDLKYLKQSKENVRNYILEKRKELVELVGEEVTVNQHKRIKDIFNEKWGIALDSSDAAALKQVAKGEMEEEYTLEGEVVNEWGETHNAQGIGLRLVELDQEAVRFAELVGELRTLEKWYSTYILRFIAITEYDGRFYTQISQCSAVSGRVGSDSQQMPKKPILKDDGTDLFNTRRVFMPTDQGKDDGYTSIWYCDLSQVELRVAANYTLLVSEGDPNLCRAYMPFQQRHSITGEKYDHKNPDHRSRWDELQQGHPDPSDFKDGLEDVFKRGWSVWEDENGEPWTPTDIHAETTGNAYPKVDPDSNEFKELRNVKGKPTNFLCLYGGGPKALAKTLDVPFNEAENLYKGYKEAFPMLDVYSQQVVKSHAENGYVQNMYGRRYYLQDSNSAYKLANYLIQGTCADDLKRAIIEVDALLVSYKTRMILTIHDECQFEVWKGEEHLIPKILEIMGDMSWSMVPIECDAEVTYSYWSEKEDAEVI